MRIALDTSVLVAFFLMEDRYHARAESLMDKIINQQIEYASMSLINVTETVKIPKGFGG